MTVSISRKKLLLAIASLFGVVNILSLLSPLPGLSGLIESPILLTLPGLLILFSFIRRSLRVSTANSLLCVGLSITFLVIGGLLINTIGPLLGIDRPLARLPLLITFDVLITLLALIATYRRAKFSFEVSKERNLNKIDMLFLSSGFLCLLLVLGGSQILNNGGSGGWVLGAIVGLSAYILFAATFWRKLSSVTLPIAIFLFGFSLLLSYSLRSNHVFGWDINGEYHVYQIANLAKHWTISGDHSPYNACLSITILPTVLASVAHVSGEVFFKIIAQGIFAFVPVAIYELSRQVLPAEGREKLLGSFLAAVIFASQTWFIEQAPALVRQEVGLFFFSLFLLVIFSKHQLSLQLSILLGVMVILSHYSTAYIMLALFLLYILAKLVIFRKHPKLLSARLLLILLAATFLWQFQMTSTANNLIQSLKQTISTLPQTFSSEGIGSAASQITFSNPPTNTQSNINNDYHSVTNEYKNHYSNLYSPRTYKSYSPSIIPVLTKSTTPILKNSNASTLILDLGKLDKAILSEILPMIGLLAFGLLAFRKRKQSEVAKNYTLLAAASISLIAIMLILPLLKSDYNLTRLWLQALIVLSPLIVVGTIYVTSSLPRVRYKLLATLSALFLLYSAGVIPYLATGEAPAMFSNNTGDYALYYTTGGEALSAKWLNSLHTSAPIYADQLASLKLSSQGGITNTQDSIYPSTITNNSYVYADQTNLNGINLHYSKSGGLLQYSFPTYFLQQQKNVVYANPNSDIYK